MLAWKRWTTAAAVAGALLVGGLATATSQEAEGPALNADTLAAELELDDDGRAELEQLVDLMGRRHEARREMRTRMTAMRGQMHEVMRSLHERLSPQQAGQLHRAMRKAMHGQAMMGGGGPMHRGMGSGHGAHMGRAGHPHAGMGGGMMQGAGEGMHADCPWVTGNGGDEGGPGS